jgi:hypothetical protein
MAMPLYQFAAHNGHRLDDPEGAELLPDDESARQAALHIIRDMKRNNHMAWNGWTIEVTEGNRQVWQIPFIGAE